ncbi:MAG: DNA adenine methylase [Syntrophobacteraceae bacterium]
MGGKSRLAKRIVDLLPEHQAYAEVFAGGAWVFFRKPESKFESINDLNSDLICFYRVLQNHLEEFCRQFKFCVSSREWFGDWDRQLATGGLTDIQRSARFYYVQRHSFAADVVGRSFGRSTHDLPRINLLRLEEELSAVHLRMAKVTIENLPWHEYMKRYDSPSTFFYADPPYFGFEDLYGRNMFSREDFSTMAARLGAIRGKFLMSINDVPEIRTIYSEFRIQEVQTAYSSKRNGNTPARELLISNY